ncbi:MAG: DUF192 domain-containing protein [Coriobacteriales bacterium]|jgi:uncharacterized membrane protein (UPF0127 family)|nr:DUF192 domain-containing protein [Coriobacteriales bacterium]
MMVKLASSVRSRLVGLLSGQVCPDGEILMLVPCSSVHTYGMREHIDVAFIDSSFTVLTSHRRVPPARKLRHPHATAVLERRSCSAPWCQPGERLMIE